MAASTANMVQSKDGKMYEKSSTQGKVIVASATVGKDAGFEASRPASKLGSAGGMEETLQLIYGETQESSESLDNIEEALVDGTEETAAERAARLNKSNKDKAEKTKGNKFTRALGAGKDKLGAGLSKIKSSLGGKLGLALLGGALVLLNKYSDELAGPEGILTKFLKYTKEQLIPDIKALYADIQVWWDIGWEKVKGFFGYIAKIFEQIGAYMDKFDTDGTPGLSEDEMKLLKDDLVKKALALTTSIVTDMFGALSLLTVGLFVVGGLGYAALKGAVTGTFNRLFRGGVPSGGGGGSVRGSAKPKPKGSLISKLVKSLVIGTSAFTGTSVGGNTAKAALKPGQAINKAGSIYNKADGRIVTTASKFKHLSKYPRLLSAARKIPFLGPALSTAFAIDVMTNDKYSKEDKIREMGGIMGGALGSIGFGIAGGMIGSAFPIIGTGIGAIVGSLGGFFGGDWAGRQLAAFLFGKERELESSPTLGGSMDAAASASSVPIVEVVKKTGFSDKTATTLNSSVATSPRPDKNFFGGDRQGLLWDEKYGMTHNPDGSVISKAPLTMDAQLREADAAGAQRHALKAYHESIAANTEIMGKDELLKTNQLIAARKSKELMLEMKADNAKQNKFNTYTSQDQRTSTQINNANYVNSMSARNDFWQEYYMHKAAAN